MQASVPISGYFMGTLCGKKGANARHADCARRSVAAGTAKRWYCALALFLYLQSAVAEPCQEGFHPGTTIRKDVNLVLVNILVTDNRGNTLNGLRAIDVTLMDNGIPQEIAHFSQDRIPLAIAVVVDVSESMSSLFEPVRAGISNALPSLKPDDRVAIFSLSSETKLVVELTRDGERLNSGVRRLWAHGVTNIHDAIYRPAKYLREAAPDSQRVIILISDMMHTSGGMSDSAVERELLEASATLFAVRVYSRAVALNEGLSLRKWVSELASFSGGEAVEASRGIQRTIELIFAMVKRRYTVGFYPTPQGEPGTQRRITVRLNNDEIQRVMPGAFVRHRSHYTVPRPEAGESCPPNPPQKRP